MFPSVKASFVEGAICSSFVQHDGDRGSCSSNNCELLHHSMPYLWQILNDGVWQNLEHESQDIEAAFCNPDNTETWVNLLVTYVPNNSQLQLKSQINFDLMQVAVENSQNISSIRRLSTSSYIKSNSSLATQWRWYWQQGLEWKEFGTEKTPLQRVMEAKYLHNQIIYRYELLSTPDEAAAKTFFICFRNFKMNNMAGVRWILRRRPMFVSKVDICAKIRLESPPPSAETLILPPKDWMPLDPLQDVELIPLSPESFAYHLVASEFHKTLPAGRTICDVFMIQNIFLWSKYFCKKQNMLKKSSSSAVKELQLFHGTNDQYTVQAIFRQNFDPRVCGKNATAFGKGSYFATDASLSDKYCRTGSKRSVKWMFLARCLVGEYTTGQTHYTRPPPIVPSIPNGLLYDSCVNDVKKPTIYVLFDSDQCYPEYAISYRLSENTALVAD